MILDSSKLVCGSKAFIGASSNKDGLLYFRACESNLRASAHRTQQLGGVSHCGSSVAERRGELGRLAEVVLRVLWRLVGNTCRHVEQRENKQKVLMVKQLQP